jgi:hypothetical protein
MIRQCHLPVHILRHSEAVRKMGVFLAHRLAEKGIAVDIDLVDRACRLHDLFRVCDFPLEDFSWFEQPVTETDKAKWRRLKAQNSQHRHEEAAHAFLKDRYPVLAETVRQHKYTAVLETNGGLRSWEAKLVYYADKRAMHDRIVPLKERLEEAHRRNALVFPDDDAERRTALERQVDGLIFELEAEIFRRFDAQPDDVTEELIDSYLQEAVL